MNRAPTVNIPRHAPVEPDSSGDRGPVTRAALPTGRQWPTSRHRHSPSGRVTAERLQIWTARVTHPSGLSRQPIRSSTKVRQERGGKGARRKGIHSESSKQTRVVRDLRESPDGKNHPARPCRRCPRPCGRLRQPLEGRRRALLSRIHGLLFSGRPSPRSIGHSATSSSTRNCAPWCRMPNSASASSTSWSASPVFPALKTGSTSTSKCRATPRRRFAERMFVYNYRLREHLPPDESGSTRA
jgi:hypothetical protein